MFPISKVIHVALSCLALSAFVSARESLGGGGGGAGGGSDGRGFVKASSNSSPIAATTNIASTTPPVGSNGSSNSNSIVPNNNSGNTNNDINRPSTNNMNNSNASNNNASNNNGVGSTSEVSWNTGSHGTLADRLTDVACPICNAVPDKSYDASHMVNVGNGNRWSCGYLQESVQDVNMGSFYIEERNSCRQTQELAEREGCCGDQIMYHGQPGVDLNDPCLLCPGSVPPGREDELVNTGVMGSHTCSSLQMVMREGMISANLCPAIVQSVGETCCTLPSMGSSATGRTVSRTANLRGNAPLR